MHEMSMGPDPVAVLSTILFSITGLYCAIRVVTGWSALDRLHNVAHLLMSAGMAVMPWPAWAALPVPLVIVVFAVATLFYLALLLFRRQAGPIDPAHHHASPTLLVYHALMMASMIWMAIAMAPEMMRHPAAWAPPVSIGWGAFFALAAVWLLVRLVGQTRRGAGRTPVVVLDAVAAVLMAVGMAVEYLLLMV